MKTVGIHHITSITRDAQKNIDFYANVLGLRLVKVTVNFDDPSSYHLYYGDKIGSPGTLATFFVWPNLSDGRVGTSTASVMAFSIPKNSIAFWKDHLSAQKIHFTTKSLFGEDRLELSDPDGLAIELVETKVSPTITPWTTKKIASENALHGFHSATLCEKRPGSTVQFMTDIMGYKFIKEKDDKIIFCSKKKGPANFMIIDDGSKKQEGSIGAGSIHHIAFRTKNKGSQSKWRQKMLENNTEVTPIIDRQYFQSIYFKEPGRILFEIATDEPGMLINERSEDLGSSMKLPPQYESHREEIETILPKLKLPHYDK